MAVPTNSLNNIVSFDSEKVKRFPVAAGVKFIAGYLAEVSGAAGVATYALDTGPVLGVVVQNVDNTNGADGDAFVDIATEAEVILEGNATLAAADGSGMNLPVYPVGAPTTDGLEVTHTAGTNQAGRVVAFENTNDQHGLSFPVRVRVRAGAA